MDTILVMEGISKSFPGVKALQRVNFSVQAGEVHCLIGANGAGKSTLMKILAGVYTKDEGDIYISGKKVNINSPSDSKALGISVIYQELSLIEQLSVAENIFMGSYLQPRFGVLSWKRLREEAAKIIGRLGMNIDVDKKVADLSMGHKQIVELAKSLAANAKIIIMDEPSTTLSGEEISTLFRVIDDLKKQNITIIYISHKLEELFAVGDRVTVLRDGKWIATRNLSEITQDQLTELIIGHKIEKSERSEKHRNVVDVLVMKDIGNDNLSGINLRVGKGEIVGLYGLVGSGRTELLKTLYGVDPIKTGAIYLNGQQQRITSPKMAIQLGFGLVPENRKTEGAILGLSIAENAILPSYDKFSRGGVIRKDRITKAVQEKIRELNVKAPNHLTELGNLSGGNQQKVIISKWLIRESQILLFDEPTQGIDIGAKQEIYRLMRELSSKGTAMIVASSEINELLEVCHRIYVMFRGRIVGEFRDPSRQKEEILHYAVTGGHRFEHAGRKNANEHRSQVGCDAVH